MRTHTDADQEQSQLPIATAADVRVAHIRWFDALLAEDVVILDTLLADNMTFHSPFGIPSTKAAFTDNLRSGRLMYDSIVAEEPLIRIHGQTAIVTGNVDIAYRWDGQEYFERLLYTAVYGYVSPSWQMLAWQSTYRQDESS